MKQLGRLGDVSLAYVALSTAAIAQTPQKVLRFVPQYESTVLDPVTSILQVTHQAALLPYDTLLARDAAGEVRPQMLESLRLDSSNRIYTLVLRPNLRFHDGSPVRAADVVASIRRWAARDNAGVWLSRFGMQLAVVDDRMLTIETPSPTPIVQLALSAPADPPFIMRERDAMNPPEKAVADIVGSGPFRFVAGDYVPGNRIVYARNPDYVPREEPASAFAGGKRVFVDRVEFHIMPDPATAAAALQKGEVDLWEAPPLDLLPLLRQQTHLVTRSLKTGRSTTLARARRCWQWSTSQITWNWPAAVIRPIPAPASRSWAAARRRVRTPGWAAFASRTSRRRGGCSRMPGTMGDQSC
jgi:peptide/nickel transport system substrate-binding protein